ncbi:LysR family transcriptional regulator [Vibrio gallicus]|uniref:LysR family transcriptional regulator n=1 Tax=Vibrio gallicus TaxID=190897 RepID=UPI0021C32C22|nr:LysR family transcriptional regulator [Vibrio gallicus]
MKTLEQQLSRLDLNLLVSLSVLLKEKNVSRAAETLYLSQPAMSRTLKRLRDVFDDPLFYRESAGLQPTDKAISLQEPLAEILMSVNKLIDSTKFSPELCDQTFKISLPPLMSRQLSVPLVKQLMQTAPNASLLEYPAAKDPEKLLKQREVDFSIHVTTPTNSDEFPSELIGTTYGVIYGMKNHPLADKDNVTIEHCMDYPFMDLNLDLRSDADSQNPIDDYLKPLGLSRNISFKSGQVNTLIDAMEGSNSLLVSTHTLGSVDNFQHQLVPILSMQGQLDIGVYLLEHRRTSNSAPHQWLKNLILSTLRGRAFIYDK